MQYTLNDLTNSNNLGLTKLQKAEKVYIYILQKHKASRNKTMSSSEIWKEYQKLSSRKDFIEIKETSCNNNLSTLASMKSSCIQCDGTGKGYYLEFDIDENGKDDPSKKGEIEYKEEMTYPLLERWLSVACDRVLDIHGKNGMKLWGNPDILGINSFDYYGNRIVEVTSIEAKVNLKEWRKLIFEAVAHTMFVNRSYFAFIVRESEVLPEDISVYAQKFGIGLLAIVVPNTEWGKELKYEKCRFDEILPPLKLNPSLKLQREFLNKLGIVNSDQLLKFGKSSDDFEK